MPPTPPGRVGTSRGSSSEASRRPSAATGRCCPTSSTSSSPGSTPSDPANEAAVETLGQARADKLDKGEVLVCHVVGTGMDARIVAVERHRT